MWLWGGVPSQRCRCHREGYVNIVNYTKQGAPFDNLLYLCPLYDAAGHFRFYMGAQGLAKDWSTSSSHQSAEDQTSGSIDMSGPPPPSGVRWGAAALRCRTRGQSWPCKPSGDGYHRLPQPSPPWTRHGGRRVLACARAVLAIHLHRPLHPSSRGFGAQAWPNAFTDDQWFRTSMNSE